MLNLAPWVCFPRVFPSAFSLSHSASHPAAVLFLPLPLSLQLCCRGLEANSSIYESRTYNFFFLMMTHTELITFFCQSRIF